ncbi:MAG: BON domain-containing protein [Deltaproteobacteria bacterium]|nr:BON domain-containing protein [Deltaproteobacteria bacterium]
MKKTTYRLALMVTVASLFLTNVPLFASATDDRIESAAKQSYVFKTYLKGDDIKIQAKDGVATLTGTVSEESHKALAKETVASLPGVTSVDNKLEEKGEVHAVNKDAWLSSKVKATLLFHRNVNAIGTEVIAKDGAVTLRGEATSSAQKDLTTEYAKDVEGVKNVKNEMVVSTAATKPGAKTMGAKMDTMGEKMGETMGAMGETIDDASITALVKTTLLYHRSTSALNTTVETKEGVVNLGGKAKNEAEKTLATKLVSDVHGVKMVINNMTVGGVESKKGVETKKGVESKKKGAIEGC